MTRVSAALKDLGVIVGGGTPSTKEPSYFGEAYPWITPKDLSRQASRFISVGERGISESGLAASSAKVIPAGSVIISSRAPIGLIAIATVPVTTNQGCRSFVPGPRVDSLYMYYLLGSMKDEFVRRANGSTFLEISGSVLGDIEIDVPSIEEQRAVAAVLGALDDKIESNGRAVDLIEDLLLLEFQRLVAGSHVGDAPLSELVSIIKGVSYRSVDLKPSRTSLVTLKSFDRSGGYKANGLKPYTGPYKLQQVVQPGELVIAQTDLTQGAEVIGRTVRIPSDPSADTLVASLDLVIVRPSGDMTQEYLQGILTDESFRGYCRSRTSGTTVLHLAGDAIPSYEAPLVPLEQQEQYSNFARPLIERADALNHETDVLAQARDDLLPGLLAGQIRVRNSERVRA